MKTLILGLGNTVLTDDGAGVYTARALRDMALPGVDVLEAETAGMDLMEMLDGYDRAVIIDAIQLEGVRAGTVFRLVPDDLRITPRLASCHDIDIVTALELGRRLGLKMPGDVTIFAVQGEDMLTLHEGCLEAVAGSIPRLAGEIASMIEGVDGRRISMDLADRRPADA